jgi:CHASE2 domain-containing sensor protein
MLVTMKLIAALGVFAAAALLIAAGMVLAVHGKPWLLVASSLAFLIGFARIGCTQH